MGYPFASNEMVSNLAFSTFKAGLPGGISKAHREAIIKGWMLQSLSTQVDFMDPNLSFLGPFFRLIFTYIDDWEF